MAASIQLKRGATAKVAAYTPLSGEMVLDTTTNKLYVGDGSTAGGKQVVASRIGVTDSSSATSGEIGGETENTSSSVSISSSGAATNITSITLPAGDWDICGTLQFNGTASITTARVSINSTSATLKGFPYDCALNTTFTASTTNMIAAPLQRVNISASTTLYLIGLCNFASGSVTAAGFIRARRVR
ncbi:hyaluronate lyase N-terminal domain-containing protein [Pantoea anthophila]|uniref:hyaluronate lyase N-terminal domain-containing protein n=1 Tax=Pantoea anthophila TaxID=470931 RepID=UPI002DB80CBD|nr:hypothetical protein [Pantoea anthophila]MEB5707358.1 hypothetical protein [Pantoea anthophila]MEB6518229.1 hypothetical protein [Pantoea anthophila]